MADVKTGYNPLFLREEELRQAMAQNPFLNVLVQVLNSFPDKLAPACETCFLLYLVDFVQSFLIQGQTYYLHNQKLIA